MHHVCRTVAEWQRRQRVARGLADDFTPQVQPAQGQLPSAASERNHPIENRRAPSRSWRVARSEQIVKDRITQSKDFVSRSDVQAITAADCWLRISWLIQGLMIHVSGLSGFCHHWQLKGKQRLYRF